MATTASLIHWLAAGVSTASGGAASSGKVRFYQPGTLVSQVVYSDSAAASTLTQPITLNGIGQATVYATNPVRMIVKDSADVSTLYDVVVNVRRAEQVYVTSTSFNAGAETQLSAILDGWGPSAGGVLGVFKYKRTGAPSERTIAAAIGESKVSVKDWSAAGDGVTDDALAFSSAVAQISGEGGGIVSVPPGTYIISSAFTLPANVSLVGAGSAASIIKQTNATANAINVSAAGVGNNRISGVQITHATTSTGIGISCVSTSSIRLDDVVLGSSKFATGVKFSACSKTSIENCFIYGRDTGAGTGRAIQYTTSGDSHIVIGGEVGADATGTCFELDTGTSGFLVIGVGFLAGAVGAKFTSSNNDDVFRFIGCIGLSSRIGTPFSEVVPSSRALYQTANFVDGYTVDVAAAGSHTPSPLLRGPNIRIRATSAGAIAINALATNPVINGFRMVLHFYNNGGGAITWNLNALYHVNTTIPTTDTHHIMVEFAWDANATCFRELTRADTT